MQKTFQFEPNWLKLNKHIYEKIWKTIRIGKNINTHISKNRVEFGEDIYMK